MSDTATVPRKSAGGDPSLTPEPETARTRPEARLDDHTARSYQGHASLAYLILR